MIQITGSLLERAGSKLRSAVFLLIPAISFSVCNAQLAGTSSVRIVFKNMVDGVPMQLQSIYQNPFGEDYMIRMFKYYISDIAVQKADGKTVKFDGSHLINEADSSTNTIALPLPSGNFTGVSFLIGVDSIYNVSSVQTGDLDPLNGMFWTWNSGYITAKLEASSIVSTAPNKTANYHIGGFRTGQKTARLIKLSLPGRNGKTVSEIVIEANVNKWFNGAHTLKIADHPVCTTPGGLAVMYADNYAEMFRLASVK